MSRAVWEGEFSSYTEARADLKHRRAGGNGGGFSGLFSNEQWIRRQAALRQSPALTETQQSSRPSNLPLIAAVTGAQRIADFGGGSGWAYQRAKESGVSSIIEYAVIEIPSVVEAFASDSDAVLYYVADEVSGAHPFPGPGIDILYSNSAIQYLQSNKPFLDVAQQLEPRIIVLDELLWTSGRDDWFSVQLNADEPVVARFASLDTLIEGMKAIGYREVAQMPYAGLGYTFPSMPSISQSRQIQYAVSIVFEALSGAHLKGNES